MSGFAGARLAHQPHSLDTAQEEALVHQCRRKDYEAFAKIVDAYQARVFGFLKRMVRDEEDALDMTQEVFIRAFQALDRFDGRASLRTWLFRIAHNLCVDRARKAKRALATVSLGEGDDEATMASVDHSWNPESVAMTAELRDVLEQSLAGMSEKLRTVLLLHDREEMAYEEIATVLDIPVGTVKSRLFLARAQVRDHVRGYLNGGAER